MDLSLPKHTKKKEREKVILAATAAQMQDFKLAQRKPGKKWEKGLAFRFSCLLNRPWQPVTDMLHVKVLGLFQFSVF